MNVPASRAVRLERLAPICAAGLAFAIATWASRPYAVGVFHDDGVYAILAKALATGEGYRYLHIPGAPLATHYPPGYPILLAGLWKLAPDFPQNVRVFLLANSMLLAVTAWSTSALARRVLGWSQAAATAAAIIATISYPLLMLSGLILSEPLFAALLLPALMAAERLARDEGRPTDAIVAGVAAGFLMLVRTHGIALVLAVVMVLLLRRRWRPATLVVAAALVVIAPWQIWVATHDAALAEPLRGSYGSYGAWLADGVRSGAGFIAATIAANVREIGELLADRFALSDHAVPRLLTGAIVGAAIAAGAVRAVRRAPVAVVFVAVYVGILLVWPFTPWRFLFAIWPLIVLFLGETALWVWQSRARRSAPALALAVIALIAIGAVRQETRAYGSRSWQAAAQGATAQIAPLVRWIAASTRPTDLVAVDGEQLVYLFTGRPAVPIVQFTAAEYVAPRSIADNAAALDTMLAVFPVRYVLTVSSGLHASADLLARTASTRAGSAHRLVPVGPVPGVGVFRVDRHGSLSSQQ